MGKKGNLRWWIISLVMLGTILNYLARSTLSVAAPTLKHEFAMTTEHYSWVVLAFQASYTIMRSVAGSILDALGTRLGFFLFAVGWAFANMAHAFATGWPSLAFFRGLLGATEAAAIPAGAKTVSEWFPPKEKPLATSIFQIGTSVGNMIAPPCIGLAHSAELAIALFCIGGFAHQMLNGALITLCTDVFDTKTVGTASGMAGTVAWTGGMAFTFLIGKSADSFGYNPLFVALAALDLIGAVALWALLTTRPKAA